MNTIEKALLVVDMSPGWESAVEVAAGLVEKFDAEIVPIHVVPSSVDTVLDSGELRKALDARLREIVSSLFADGVAFSNTVVAVGVAFDEVIRRADDENVNLILIGAGVTSVDARVRIGPLAERVMQHARKPVWVVKPGSFTRVENILCPVDTSASSARALRNAIRLAAGFGARLTVLHVVKILSERHPAVAKMKESDVWDQEFAEQRRNQFQAFLEGFDFGDTNVETKIRDGDPREEIAEAVRVGGHDLLVMGTVGRKGLTRLLMGSVTEGVIQALPCSVVTLKDESLVYARIGGDLEDFWKLQETGKELLEDGLAEEASTAFERSIAINRFHVPAWEGLADAQEALGLSDRARRSRNLARKVSEKLWRRMLEDEWDDR